MTIDEAIEGLKKILDWPYSNLSPASVKSVQLGIEALNRIQAGRVAGHILWEDKLPGETE